MYRHTQHVHTAQENITDFYTVVTVPVHTYICTYCVHHVYIHVVHRAALRERHARHDQHTTTLYALNDYFNSCNQMRHPWVLSIVRSH